MFNSSLRDRSRRRQWPMMDDMFDALYDESWPPTNWGFGTFMPLWPARPAPNTSTPRLRPVQSADEREWYKTLDMQGFTPSDVTMDVGDGKIHVKASRVEGSEARGFDKVESTRVLDLPTDIDAGTLRTAMDSSGRVCVIALRKQPPELPIIQRQESSGASGMFGMMDPWGDDSYIVDDGTGGKRFQMTFDLPGYKIDEIKVKNIGSQVTVHAEHKEDKEGNQVHREFIRSVQVPRGTLTDQLTTVVGSNGQLVISAPVVVQGALENQERLIPIKLEGQ